MKRSKSLKLISILLSCLLIYQQTGFAQVASVELNLVSHFASLQNTLTPDKFRPLHLRSISYDSLKNNFKLLLDKGDSKLNTTINQQDPKNSRTGELENSTKELFSYFLVGLALPNDSFWVNLRPDSPDNIIDPYLAQTEVGRILLEADLQLKKDTSGATSPNTAEGKVYWDKLYSKAEELYGTQNVTIPTLTRPWIVPDEIIISESTGSAYVYKATLKVMLEQDYLSRNSMQGLSYKQYQFKDPREKQLNEYSSQLIQELIIPKLTKEINNAKRYAPLRQVYYSLILAQWFKARNQNKDNQYSKLINRKNLTNLQSKTPYSVNTYFTAYKKNFSVGQYNNKETIQTPFGQAIRSYFSGGISGIAPPIPALGATPLKAVSGATITAIPIQGNADLAGQQGFIQVQVIQRESGGTAIINVTDQDDLERKVAGIEEAHQVGAGHTMGTSYTGDEIKEKMRILKRADISQAERKDLVRNGVAGFFRRLRKNDDKGNKEEWSIKELSVSSVENLRQQVAGLDYSEATARRFMNWVALWKNEEGNGLFELWKERIEQARRRFQEKGISLDELVSQEAGVIRELAGKVMAEVDVKTDFDLDDIIENKSANCTGYTTLFYILGTSLGLTVMPTPVFEYEHRKLRHQEVHIASFIRLSDGRFMQIDPLAVYPVSEPFVLDEVYNNNGNYLEVRDPANPFRVHRKIQSLRDKQTLLADIYNHRGGSMQDDVHQEIEYYRRALVLDPLYYAAYTNLASALATLDEFDEALENINRAITLFPIAENLYFNRGSIYSRAGNLAASLNDYTHAIQLNPDFAFAYYSRANVYVNQSDFPATDPAEKARLLNNAEKDLTRGIEALAKEGSPERHEFYFNRGVVRAVLNKQNEAVADLRKSIELDWRNKIKAERVIEIYGLAWDEEQANPGPQDSSSGRFMGPGGQAAKVDEYEFILHNTRLALQGLGISDEDFIEEFAQRIQQAQKAGKATVDLTDITLPAGSSLAEIQRKIELLLGPGLQGGMSAQPQDEQEKGSSPAPQSHYSIPNDAFSVLEIDGVELAIRQGLVSEESLSHDEALRKIVAERSTEGSRRYLSQLAEWGKQAKVQGPTVYYPFGGYDLTPFVLIENAADVFVMSVENFGSVEDITKFCREGTVYNRAGSLTIDRFDALHDMDETMFEEDISGIGPLAMARIAAYLGGRIDKVSYFTIRDNGTLRFLTREELSDKENHESAVIEFTVKDPHNGQPIKKRYWYIQHNVYTGFIMPIYFKNLNIDIYGLELALIKAGYLSEDGLIQPAILMGRDAFQIVFNVSPEVMDKIYNILLKSYQDNLRFSRFMESLQFQTMLIRAANHMWDVEESRDLVVEYRYNAKTYLQTLHAKTIASAKRNGARVISDNRTTDKNNRAIGFYPHSIWKRRPRTIPITELRFGYSQIGDYIYYGPAEWLIDYEYIKLGPLGELIDRSSNKTAKQAEAEANEFILQNTSRLLQRHNITDENFTKKLAQRIQQARKANWATVDLTGLTLPASLSSAEAQRIADFLLGPGLQSGMPAEAGSGNLDVYIIDTMLNNVNRSNAYHNLYTDQIDSSLSSPLGRVRNGRTKLDATSFCGIDAIVIKGEKTEHFRTSEEKPKSVIVINFLLPKIIQREELFREARSLYWEEKGFSPDEVKAIVTAEQRQVFAQRGEGAIFLTPADKIRTCSYSISDLKREIGNIPGDLSPILKTVIDRYGVDINLDFQMQYNRALRIFVEERIKMAKIAEGDPDNYWKEQYVSWLKQYREQRRILEKLKSRYEKEKFVRDILNRMARKEIEKIIDLEEREDREKDPSLYPISRPRLRPWNDGLMEDKSPEEVYWEGQDEFLRYYYHGTSLGAAYVANLSGGLGYFIGLNAVSEARDGNSYDSPETYFLPPRSSCGWTIGYVSEYAERQTRPAMAILTYYALRAEWESDSNLKNIRFPPFEYFLSRAIIRISKDSMFDVDPRVEHLEIWGGGYDSYFAEEHTVTKYLVPLDQAEILLENNIPWPRARDSLDYFLKDKDPERLDESLSIQGRISAHDKYLVAIGKEVKDKWHLMGKIVHNSSLSLASMDKSDGGDTSNPPSSISQERTPGGIDGSASSSSILGVGEKGGIDFRYLPIVTQSMDNLKGSIRNIPVISLQRIDLTREWSDIERLVNSGTAPSVERLKEYFAASCFKGYLDSDIGKILSCIASILRMEEESCCLTDPTLKDMLVVLGSGRNAEELKLAFSG